MGEEQQEDRDYPGPLMMGPWMSAPGSSPRESVEFAAIAESIVELGSSGDLAPPRPRCLRSCSLHYAFLLFHAPVLHASVTLQRRTRVSQRAAPCLRVGSRSVCLAGWHSVAEYSEAK